jgi:DNA-binding IclR family transcriptional regulator
MGTKKQMPILVAQKGVAAVDRALSILVALGDAQRALTLSETAVATGLYKSTTLRLLGSLERAGFTVRDQDGRFRLGSTVYKLASTQEHAAAIEDVVAPVLQRIVEKTGESVGFFVRQGDQRFCLLRANSPHPLRHHIAVGVPRPLSLGAAGRVLKQFENGATHTPPPNFGELPIAVLGQIPDLGTIAVPVFGAGGKTLGAISVSGPLSRFDRRRIAQIKSLLREIAITLTERFGGNSKVFRWRSTSS